MSKQQPKRDTAIQTPIRLKSGTIVWVDAQTARVLIGDRVGSPAHITDAMEVADDGPQETRNG